jgi:hypothetical protein
VLVEGYKRIIRTIYSGRAYMERVLTFLKEYRLPESNGTITMNQFGALLRALWRLGVLDPEKGLFWSLLRQTLRDNPRKLPQAVTLAIKGFHFRRVAAEI